MLKEKAPKEGAHTPDNNPFHYLWYVLPAEKGTFVLSDDSTISMAKSRNSDDGIPTAVEISFRSGRPAGESRLIVEAESEYVRQEGVEMEDFERGASVVFVARLMYERLRIDLKERQDFFNRKKRPIEYLDALVGPEAKELIIIGPKYSIRLIPERLTEEMEVEFYQPSDEPPTAANEVLAWVFLRPRHDLTDPPYPIYNPNELPLGSSTAVAELVYEQGLIPLSV